MMLKMVNQVLLTVFPEEVEPDAGGDRRPLEVVEGVRGLDLAPAGSSVEHSFHHWMVVPSQHDVLVKVLLFLEFLFI